MGKKDTESAVEQPVEQRTRKEHAQGIWTRKFAARLDVAQISAALMSRALGMRTSSTVLRWTSNATNDRWGSYPSLDTAMRADRTYLRLIEDKDFRASVEVR